MRHDGHRRENQALIRRLINMADNKRMTRLIRAGRPETGWVNTPPTRASTYVFDTVASWRDTRVRRETERLPSYGARGTDTSFALEDALVELEQGHRCFLFPTGQAAIATTLLALLKPGDHVLLTDAVYEPVRNFCKHQLTMLGITHTFYQPDGGDIATKIQPNTRVIYVESPGSITYDMVDLPAVATLAKQHDICVVADNTWGSGWIYQPLALGADISIIAITKYIGGHSDLMMGASIANERYWPMVQKAAIGFGQTASPDDAFMALRGIRTMPMRIETQGQHALLVATWLENHPAIARVFFPALTSDPNHERWKEHCSGMNGLLSFELLPQYPRSAADRLIDSLKLFGLGASWGGFESLVIPADLAATRTLTDWTSRGPVIRIHIGLEDPADLIQDLEQALATLK